MSELKRPTIDDYHALYQRGEEPPSQVLERTLSWARHVEHAAPSLEAFVILDEADARAQAARADARWAAGAPLGPLDGVPVAIKDEFHVAGYPTAAGTRFLGTRPDPYDCAIVERLRAAGAIILGKTTMHEIGMGGTGVNPEGLTARNPYDARYMTGGSSSGSGAAVGAGVVPVALGSDAGGSIRIPASFCGVYGVKATHGRIPTTGGALLARTLDHTGPLGASLQDLAYFIDATAGAAPGDAPTSLAPPHEPIGAVTPTAPEALRLAWCPDYIKGATEEVAQRFHEALDALRAAGASVEAVELPHHDLIQPVGYVTLVSEAAASQRDHLRDHREQYSLPTRLLLAIGERVTASEYLHAQRVRGLIREVFEGLLLDGRFHAFISPTTGCTAPPITTEALHGGEVNSDINAWISMFTFAGNLTGLPCVSIPAGVDRAGLPIGLQLMGAPWREAALLAHAAAVDALTPAAPRPRHFRDVLREGV